MSIYKAHNVSSRLNLRRRFSISIIFGRNIPKKMWLDETVMLFPICTTWGKFKKKSSNFINCLVILFSHLVNQT